MAKDWVGNNKSVYTTLGASNHTVKERESNDYYATEPKATELLCDLEHFSKDVWECACGAGHISKVLEKRGYNVYSTDLIDRGYGESGVDFLKQGTQSNYALWQGDIITNPPYKYATQFVRTALKIIGSGHKVAMFLKLQFLEGKERRKLFDEHPPKTLYVSSARLQCAKNADFEGMQQGGGSAVAFGWFVWEKGYKGNTIIKWFN